MTASGTRVALALSFCSLALAACASDDAGGHGSKTAAGTRSTIDVTLTDDGCDPNALSATAGPTTFHVRNDDSAAVTEFEVLKDSKIVGEVENIAAGLDRSLSLTLQAGTYRTRCNGGKNEYGVLEVADAGTGATKNGVAAEQAVRTYLDYVEAEATKLVAATRSFVTVVKQGDVAGAKSQFASARYHYETIEPIAESFGDLDPAIDARAGDVPAAEWTGFHRIEKALWVSGSLTGMSTVADKLAADVGKLHNSIASIALEPARIANGAVELLNEVSASKITGEEDRYSHTDLSDFAANVEGSKAAFQAVRPLLATNDATPAATIDRRFTAVQHALDTHKVSGGANGYVLYTSLGAAETRVLATKIDALAEPLSKVAAIVLT